MCFSSHKYAVYMSLLLVKYTFKRVRHTAEQQSALYEDKFNGNSLHDPNSFLNSSDLNQGDTV
jgi:hypothetical protein